MAILKKHNPIKCIPLLVLLFMVMCGHLISGTITRNSKLTGSSIVVGNSVGVQDDIYGWTTTNPPAIWDFTDNRTDNRIFLRYSAANKKQYNTAWSVEVKVNIQRYNKQGIALTPLTTTLNINYDPLNPYTDVATFTTTGGHRVRVNITSITLSSSLGGVMPSDVSLENELQIERYYDIFSNTSYNLSHIAPTSTDKFAEIYWNFIAGAEEYDIEYFLLSDYAPPITTLTDAHFANATRISTPNNWHRVNMAFDNGKLYYRVRAIGVGGAGLNSRLEANWIYCTSPVNSIINFHTKSNWTYNSVFAEEGKTKETVTFSDGSQRSRQTISLSNTDNVTLVSENFYDFEGRPAIQTLPAPNNAYDNDLLFYSNFSLDTTISLYKKKIFDNGDCSSFNYAMHTSSGASNYYSSSNNYLTTTSAKMFYPAIPDAIKYPMSRTTYNNENERNAVSGTGVYHKIGSTHETVFLNATASQEKLDRLFGNEIGHAQHYKEEVVIDPNGQISVSFKNLSGQVVATAMRGETPTNLTTLKDPVVSTDEPYMTAETIKEDLTVLNLFNSSTNEFVVTKDFLVTNAGPAISPTPYNFVYEMTPKMFKDLCTNNPFPCKYILKISITDACNQPLSANSPMNTYLNTDHYIDSTIYTSGYSVAFTMNFPSNGIYKIKKTLKLDPAAIAAYIKTYQTLADSSINTCIKTLSQLEGEHEANMDKEECLSCEEYCITVADTMYNHIHNFPIDSVVNHNPSPTGWKSIYDSIAVANCNGEPVQKGCDGLLKKLKTDVSPGGQYFEHVYTGTFGTTTISGSAGFIDLLYGMNPNTSISPPNNFEFNFKQFLLVNSYPAISPGNFTQSYISSNWQSYYADFLVQFHPEYCRYQRCLNLAPSESYDYLLQSLNYSQAKTTDVNGNICSAPSGCAIMDTTASGPKGISVRDNDPFFLTSVGSASATSMGNEITNCATCAALVGAAPVVLGTCSIPSGGSMWDYANCYPIPISSSDPNYYHLQWRNFIVIYQYIKKKYQSAVPCSSLIDGSMPPDLITSSYNSSNNFGAIALSPPVSYPIDNGLNIIDPDLNKTITDYLTTFPPLSSSTSTPSAGFGSQYGPDSCWYDASYIDLGGDYAGNTSCTQFMSTGQAYPAPANSGLKILYRVSSVPGYSGIIDISNTINLPNAPQPALTYLNIIANDINTYISTPDFNASVDLSNPSLPKLIITAPVSMGPVTSSGTPIKLTIVRTETSLGTDTCKFFNFNPSVRHCEQYFGPDCVCGEIQELIDAYNSITSPTLTLYAYIRNQLNLKAYGTITLPPAQVTASMVSVWMANCSDHGSPLDLLADGELDETTYGAPVLHDKLKCDSPCNEEAQAEADYAAQQEYEAAVEASVQDFIKNYSAACFRNINELFTVDYPEKEYHYTLYYYDQAGNLTRTVPPVAVKRIPASLLYTGTGGLNIINQLRNVGTYSIYPGHSRVGQTSGSPPSGLAPNYYVTNYIYNSYNQLTQQETPDGGLTKFWYDDLGRLRFSQNAKQLATACYSCAQLPTDYKRYSYTMYDAQNRIVEVGENDEVYAVTTPGSPPITLLYSFAAAINDQNFPSQPGLQVTKTYYDNPLTGNLVSTAFIGGQQYLRKRVVASTYEDVEDANDNTYNHGTFYSYDVHGNVSELVQDNPDLALLNERYKWMGYDYDLISGKVNTIHFQNGKRDQFHHKYYYDADNRLVSAYTSGDHVHFERDARYFYYLHGPLARAEFGDEKVQGLDYVYTMQGWIKGVNGSVIDEQMDFGLDGNLNTSLQYMSTQSNIHKNFARDVFGYTLDYYHTDYAAIGGTGIKTNLTADLASSSAVFNSVPDLFNGNIRGLTHAITDPTTNTQLKGLSKWFEYDQLNRIKVTNTFTQSSVTNNLGSSLVSTTDYYEKYRYDANGNILYAKRNGNSTGTYNNSMDDMTYNYYANTNQLSDVTDPGDNTTPLLSQFGDVKTEAANNYTYDQIGNLIKDTQEEIDNIEWNVYGKIRNIYRTNTSYKPDLEFRYDAAGNRVCKISKMRVSKPGGITGVTTEENWTYTYYVRDAQGNVMAVYDRDVNYASSVLTEKYTVTENHLYGSNRMAIVNRNAILRNASLTFVGYNLDGTIDRNTPVSLLTAVTYSANYRTLGNKLFEFSNHLGNVVNTVADRKLCFDSNSDGTTDYYKTDTKSATDYYAFGAPMPNRRFTSNLYRYGMNGKEKDDEISGSGNNYDFGDRIYEARLGRLLSVDPFSHKAPFASPYSFADNNPIWKMDNNGDSTVYYTESGQFLFLSNDGLSNSVVIVKKADQIKWDIWKKQGDKSGLSHRDSWNQELRKFGLTYNTGSIKKFYNQFKNTRFVNPAGEKTKWTAEHGAHLFNKGGQMNIGDEVIAGDPENTPWRQMKGDLNDADGAIHTHPGEGGQSYYYPNGGTVDVGPSPEDRTFQQQKDPTNIHIVVSKSAIFFYGGNLKKDIVIPFNTINPAGKGGSEAPAGGGTGGSNGNGSGGSSSGKSKPMF